VYTDDIACCVDVRYVGATRPYYVLRKPRQMATKARKRAHGAGRKPLHPDGSNTVVLRIESDLLNRIGRLADKHGRDRSKEIRDAIRYWARMLEKPARHVGALVCLIAILVRRIEARTGQRWLDDPATGAFVGKLVEKLIFHFAPTSTPTEPVAIPPDIAGITGELITIMENLLPRPGVPGVSAELFGDEWATLALIAGDLGSGWDRNRAVWQKGAGS
jgi:predicted transcriptional regulator